MTMTTQFSDMTSTTIFWHCFDFLVRFSYWSKFHVNIITVSGVMTILFDKELIRYPEFGNIPIGVLAS